MKKSLFILSLFALVISCSGSDDSPAPTNNSEYTEINVLGNTYRDNPGATSSTIASSCDSNIDLLVQQFGDFGNSTFDIGIVFIHKEFQNQFQGYNINNTIVKPDFDNSSFCYDNFDFILQYYDNVGDEVLILDTTFNNTNTIQSITNVNEDSEEITYAIKGIFSLRFKKANNSLVPITGHYNRFIYVLK
jgi:hypothetical protein